MLSNYFSSLQSILVPLVTAGIILAGLHFRKLIHVLKSPPKINPLGASIALILGSGGHTTELLRIAEDLDFSLNYTSRTWVYFGTDELSMIRAVELERSKQNEKRTLSAPIYKNIPRAREVGQSYITSIWTTLICLEKCISFIFDTKPDIVLCNGPGSCVMIAYACLIYKFLAVRNIRIIYVESFARVESLSLSGRLLLPIVDRFIVQWQHLAEKYEGTEYYGVLA
ncbi:UDP-N-acetylglucosamine transferase subunit ALG14 [Lipomyces oligophaga]|uniref:UDP-N-acetylglucosamine transferase subunit ALG14 n=1 Tax=Lipomyces oligophaga TaxID=45792 RepID=UPI0034CDEEAF